MDWVEIIDLVLTRVLYPLLALLITMLANYIRTKIKDVRIERVALQVIEAAGMAVATVAQTFVDDLKKSGEWNADTAKQAADMALEIAKGILGEQSMKLLSTITSEVDDYLKAAIEEAVRIDKF